MGRAISDKGRDDWRYTDPIPTGCSGSSLVLRVPAEVVAKAQCLSLRLCWVGWRLGLYTDAPIVFRFELSAVPETSARAPP